MFWYFFTPIGSGQEEREISCYEFREMAGGRADAVIEQAMLSSRSLLLVPGGVLRIRALRDLVKVPRQERR